jgi:hypothetical protein
MGHGRWSVTEAVVMKTLISMLRWKFRMNVIAAPGLLLLMSMNYLVGAEQVTPSTNVQTITYIVGIHRSIIELTLISRSELPEMRLELLDNREGFYLRMPRRVKLESLSLAQPRPLMLIPTQDGMSVLVLVSGMSDVSSTKLDKNKIGIDIATAPIEPRKHLTRKSQAFPTTQGGLPSSKRNLKQGRSDPGSNASRGSRVNPQ